MVPITVIDDAATQGDAKALRSLLWLAKAKKFDEHFGYRRALFQAFSQIREPEAVDFLSDGEPTDGTPDQIVNEVRQFNLTRRVSIHTIGFVTQNHGGVGLKLFMQPLAQRNFGQFRLVE